MNSFLFDGAHRGSIFPLSYGEVRIILLETKRNGKLHVESEESESQLLQEFKMLS